MKKLVILLIIVSMLSACSLPYAKPDSGQFYCEELEMTLDFSTHNATYIKDGETIVKPFHTGYGADLSVENFGEDSSYEPVICGSFKYRKNKVIVNNYEDEREYVFLLVE